MTRHPRHWDGKTTLQTVAKNAFTDAGTRDKDRFTDRIRGAGLDFMAAGFIRR